MREIKFRAWYKPLGIMIEPKKIEMINFEVKVLGVYLEMDGKGFNKLRMSDFELLQYTGVQDKNGKGIYEGDVLKYTFDDRTKINVIEYSPPIFTYRNSMRWSIHEDEVIGNIYENPELLP